jgi:hypothetical protein
MVRELNITEFCKAVKDLEVRATWLTPEDLALELGIIGKCLPTGSGIIYTLKAYDSASEIYHNLRDKFDPFEHNELLLLIPMIPRCPSKYPFRDA